MGFVEVPAASFLMGAVEPVACAGDGEGPIHRVELSAYAISAHAVTNAEFDAFIADDGYTDPRWWADVDAPALTPALDASSRHQPHSSLSSVIGSPICGGATEALSRP